jgi:hypothetical protein
MQRWKTLAPAEEVAPAAAPPQACACGAAVQGDWAYCPACGRARAAAAAAAGAPWRSALTPAVAVVAVLALAAGLFIGRLVAPARPGPVAADGDAAGLRARLADADRERAQVREHNRLLRKQLMDRHDEVARQLAERNDALRKHLQERGEAVRKQIAERDASIGLLAERGEAVEQAAAEETTALRETLEDAEAQLKAWVESQEAAARMLPAGPGESAAAVEAAAATATATADGVEAYWARFDAEHPTVNGRAVWEDALRAATDELGPGHPELRERAGAIFDADLARAESAARGTPP